MDATNSVWVVFSLTRADWVLERIFWSRSNAEDYVAMLNQENPTWAFDIAQKRVY